MPLVNFENCASVLDNCTYYDTTTSKDSIRKDFKKLRKTIKKSLEGCIASRSPRFYQKRQKRINRLKKQFKKFLKDYPDEVLVCGR